jgi:hypothetical protein
VVGCVKELTALLRNSKTSKMLQQKVKGKVKVKWSLCPALRRTGGAHSSTHSLYSRWRLVVSITLRLLYSREGSPGPVEYEEAGWTPDPVGKLLKKRKIPFA